MKKFFGLGIVLAVGSMSHAAIVTHTFDISGLGSAGGFFDSFPTLTHDFGGMGTVVGVEWDVNYIAHDPSYASEAILSVDTTDDQTFDADIDSYFYGAPDAPGSFAFSGSIAANSISSDGLVFLTLWEYYDDGISPDATYGAGSWVTVSYDLVPAPGTAALMGLAGLAGIRRRR